MLWFVHDHLPAAFNGVATGITASASAPVLVPLALAKVVALTIARRRVEALLVALSLIGANLLVYTLKMLVGRVRPALWDTQWYWGSSFPSGHTLSAAAFSVAVALALARIWPRCAKPALALAMLWTGLVALSRLVLGVHWPSDVLIAICLGALIPLALRRVAVAPAPALGAQSAPPNRPYRTHRLPWLHRHDVRAQYAPAAAAYPTTAKEIRCQNETNTSPR